VCHRALWCLYVEVDANGFDGQVQNIFCQWTQPQGYRYLVNKWDLVEKDTNSVRDYEASIREENVTIYWCPIVLYLYL
jgi:GTP-binding protein